MQLKLREPNFRDPAREAFVRRVADVCKRAYASSGTRITLRYAFYVATNEGWVTKDDYRTFRVEVWVEQAALRGVLLATCMSLGVPLMPCGGFISHGALWDAACRQRHYRSLGSQGVILLLSDLDPAGVNMAPYISRKIQALAEGPVMVQRVGLTPEQAEEYGVNGHALKPGDARAPAFAEEYGDLAYELDGVPPEQMRELVERHVREFIDFELLAQQEEQEYAVRQQLAELLHIGMEEGLV